MGGLGCPSLEVLSPARYDTRPERAGALRTAVSARWDDTRAERSILWAGQPETEDCLRTLEVLLPLIKAQAALLLFKAHPRDPGYHDGSYWPVLARHAARCRDVTGSTVPEVLELAPRLVVTQFSSVAIEAGSWHPA